MGADVILYLLSLPCRSPIILEIIRLVVYRGNEDAFYERMNIYVLIQIAVVSYCVSHNIVR